MKRFSNKYFATLFFLGLVLSASIILSSCLNIANGIKKTDNQSDENNSDVNKTSLSLNNVSSLFIINPTNKSKGEWENWVSVVGSRQAVEEAFKLSSPSPYVEHTLPYSFDRTLLKPSKSRSAARGAESVSEIDEISYKVGDTHTFNIIEGYDNYGNEIIVKRRGMMKYEGKYGYFWVLEDEDEESLMTKDEIAVFAEKFDELYEKETALCGPKYYGESIYENIISPNKKVSILLFDIYEDKDEGSLLGFFGPNDYLSDYEAGNKMELLCLDSYYAKKEETASGFYSTLVHEFNHMLNFVNKDLKYDNEEDMETWYTEMLSMLVEDLFYNDLNPDYENSIYTRLELFVNRGYVFGFKNWGNVFAEDEENDPQVFFNYSNAYAFGAFLGRNYGGAALFHEIATNEYVNEKSIVEAVNKINNLNLTFEDLLKQFCRILINPKGENKEMPTLYKSVSSEVGKYSFTLNKLDLNNLAEDVEYKITPIIPVFDGALKFLDGYGFYYYAYTKPRNLKIKIENFLLCDYE